MRPRIMKPVKKKKKLTITALITKSETIASNKRGLLNNTTNNVRMYHDRNTLTNFKKGQVGHWTAELDIRRTDCVYRLQWER